MKTLPENGGNIWAQVSKLETELEAQKYQVSRLEADLKEQKELAVKAQNQVESLGSQLVVMKETLADTQSEASSLAALNNDFKIQAERVKTDLEIRTRENILLQEKLTELSGHIERLTADKVSLQKEIEAKLADIHDSSDRCNSLETQNSELQLTLRQTQRENSLMRDEMVGIQDKVMSFKAQHEVQIARRNEKISQLTARNAQLEKALNHKEGLIQSSAIDVTQLRNSQTRQEIERERLVKIVEEQKYLLRKAEEELLLSKQKMSELDSRYKQVAEALAMNRISQPTARHESPDIQPRTKPLSEQISVEEWAEKHANSFLIEDSA